VQQTAPILLADLLQFDPSRFTFTSSLHCDVGKTNSSTSWVRRIIPRLRSSGWSASWSLV